MIDSHAHLFYDGIYQHLDEKLRFAKLAGIEYVLTVGTDMKTARQNIEVAENHDNVCCSVGIHPNHCTEEYSLSELMGCLSHHKVVAIGEIGLDYHYIEDAPKNLQIKLFQNMLDIAEQIKLPSIIHARESFDDIFDVISGYDIKDAVFHCYTDSIENARKVLDLGYYISFSGVVTFKNAVELREVVKYVPEDRFLIETDAPYLAPVPYRGKVNEPAYLAIVAECVANLRGISIERISQITSNNFFRLFKRATDLFNLKEESK